MILKYFLPILLDGMGRAQDAQSLDVKGSEAMVSVLVSMEAHYPEELVHAHTGRLGKLVKSLRMSWDTFIKSSFTAGGVTWEASVVEVVMTTRFADPAVWPKALEAIDSNLTSLAHFISNGGHDCPIGEARRKPWWIHCLTKGLMDMATSTGYSPAIHREWEAERDRPATTEGLDQSLRSFPATLQLLLDNSDVEAAANVMFGAPQKYQQQRADFTGVCAITLEILNKWRTTWIKRDSLCSP